MSCTAVFGVAVLAAPGCGDVEQEVRTEDAGSVDSPAPFHPGSTEVDAGDESGEGDGGGVVSQTTDAEPPASDDGGVCDYGDAPVAATLEPVLSVGSCPAVNAPTAACGAALCGNGQIDSCTPSSGCGEECTPVSESCDGSNLGGATCEGLGFSGGTLRCNAGCTFDVTQCNHCGTAPGIDSCGNAALAAGGATSLALASNGTAIALAWANGTPGQAGLNVAILGTDLAVQSQNGCLGADTVAHVAIAATPTGWIVAAETANGIEIQSLTATGVPSGGAKLLAGGTVPLLAANPNGGPLLSWESPDENGWVSILGTDGSVMSSGPAFCDVVEPEYGSAVFVGDGFLVGIRGSLGATVVHVDPDGTLGTPHSLGDETEYPKLAWTGTEARAVYDDFSATGAEEFVRLSNEGAPLAAPVELGSIPEYYGQAPNTTVGTDSVVLLPGYNGEDGVATHLDVARITQAGAGVYSPYTVATIGSVDDLWDYAMVPIGSDVVIAWLTAGSPSGFDSNLFPATIGLARVTP